MVVIPSDKFSPMIKTNTSSRNVNINDLIGNTCYLFGVRGYTVNGHGLWTVISNQMLSNKNQQVLSYKINKLT